MDDLWTAFITARLDEEHWEAFKFHRDGLQWSTEMLASLFGHSEDDPVIRHIARHDPARVLREVAAMRAILARHAVNSEPERWGSSHSDPAMRGQPTGHASYWCEECDHDRDYGHIGSRQQGCPTIRELAAIWSDHGDYPGAAVAP